MKCQRCGKEMRNTIGGCYICDECGFGINDLVYRGGGVIRTNELPDDMQKAFYDALNSDNLSISKPDTATTITDGLVTQSNTGRATIFGKSKFHNQSDYTGGWARQGWQCPKCGAILSPDTPFCPFCSRQNITPTFTCGTSGEYINLHTPSSISKEKG